MSADSSESIHLVAGRLQESSWSEDTSLGPWRDLERKGFPRSVIHREVLFSEGDPLHTMFIVRSGLFALLKDRCILDLVEPGQSIAGPLLGSMNVDSTYPITAKALSPGEVIEVSAPVAIETMKGNQSIDVLVHEQFKTRMTFMQNCRMWQRLPVRERLGNILIAKQAAFKHGPITRATLAQMASTTVESAIRILADWERIGAVKIANKKLLWIDELRIRESK